MYKQIHIGQQFTVEYVIFQQQNPYTMDSPSDTTAFMGPQVRSEVDKTQPITLQYIIQI